MGNIDTETIDEPVPEFEISDLLMSRTDDRGVILSGNDAFQKISGFDWGDLIGAPQKIVRHPDMPKAAFWLFWDALKNGEPFGGYIKNRAKDGRYYWVFAVAVPVTNGYLSVRLKPTSPILAQIEDIYRDVLERETSDDATPEDGATRIEAAMRAMDFRSYRAFMAYALGVEIAHRCQAMDIEVAPGIGEFDKIGQLLSELDGEVKGVQRLYQTIGNSPANLNILGSRLSTGREPIQVVAQNYGMLSAELMRMIGDLSNALTDLLHRADLGRMGHSASVIYSDALSDYEQSARNRGTDGHKAELAILKSALADLHRTANLGCEQIRLEVHRFSKQTDRLKKMLSGLALTRVICRIESASIAEDTSSIDEIAARLTQFQDDLGVSLDKMGSMCATMSGKVPNKFRAPGDKNLTAAVES